MTINCLEKSHLWNHLFNDVDKTLLWLVCSRDTHRPQTLRTLTLLTLGSSQRFRVLVNLFRWHLGKKKWGSRGVCVQKQTHLRLVHTHNYLTNNEQGQSTIAGSCPDVPRWPHMYTVTHALRRLSLCGLLSQPMTLFCFTYFQLTKFWKGQGGTAGPNTVCITLISLPKRNDWDLCDHPLGEDECNSGALMSKRFDSESTSISCWSYDFGKTYWISAASLMKKRK